MDLIEAVKINNLERVRLLVEQGADKHKVDSDGCTPFWLASYRGHLEVAQYLVEQGASLEKATTWGGTPLIAAALDDHLEVTRYLLEQGTNREASAKILPSTMLLT